MQDNSSGWGNEDSWDEPQVQSKRQPAVSKQSESGWKETREWDEKEGKLSSTIMTHKIWFSNYEIFIWILAIQTKRAPPAAHAPPQQSRDESGWNDEEDSSPPNPSRSSNQDASRLASIFPNSVTINDDKVKVCSIRPEIPSFYRNDSDILHFNRKTS